MTSVLDRCVHELIEEQSRRTPEAVALEFEGATLSYAELNHRANTLALQLMECGVGPGVLVALLVDRSFDMVVSLLAIMKAGGAYVPLDPTYPAERLSFMVSDCGVRVLLTQSKFRGESIRGAPHQIALEPGWEALALPPEGNPRSGVGIHDLAYVIYTSGSTGRPKGVMVGHGSLTNLLLAMLDRPGLTRADTLLAVSSLSFDISGLELYLPLVAGGRVVLLGSGEAGFGRHLADRLEASRATVLQATPTTWRMLLAAGWRGVRGLKMLCGGEVLTPELAAALLDRGGQLWNLYGPTEATVWCTLHRVGKGERPVPIGRPIPGTTAHVLDDDGQPMPSDAVGELYIGGVGVSLGYVNEPELTAQRFVPDPFSKAEGARMYRTGDLARRRHDGAIEFIGRSDHQVKVRGHRIELEEIEATLAGHPGVHEVVALTVSDPSGVPTHLVAYVAPTAGSAPTPLELRKFLLDRVPPYMVPLRVTLLDGLPHGATGKLDRRAVAELLTAEESGAGSLQ